MRLLLDTHALLWFVFGDPQLSPMAHALISDPANERYVSMASQWEIAIKVGIGKLNLRLPLADFFSLRVDANGFLLLPIERGHILRVSGLPMHHRDPFDRLLAAQSLHEAMPLVSGDAALDSYGVTRLWQQEPPPPSPNRPAQ